MSETQAQVYDRPPKVSEPRDVRPAWCFVLPWSVKGLHGGVNQVVINLLRDFESDPSCAWRTLAIETDWSNSVVEDPTVSSTEVLKLPLHAPFADRRSVWTGASFLLHLPLELLKLTQLIKKHRIEVFNVHYVDAEALLFPIFKALGLFKGRLILSLHGSDLRKGFQKRGLKRWLWKWMLRRADAVVACSDGLREETLMLESAAKVVTIYNGIDVSRFATEAPSNFRLPEQLKNRSIVIQVGSFQHRKGHDLLVKAFRAVHDKHPDTALVLIGEKGPVFNQIVDLIETLKLTGSVHLLQDLSHGDIYNYLSASSVFVLASRWQKGIEGEGFAIAVLEAGAVGIPVVATESCGVKEIIQDNVTGRLVPLEDVDALTKAVLDLLENPELSKCLAATLHRRVSDEFTWGRAANDYLSLAAQLTS